MKVRLNDIDYKGQHFEEVIIDIPKITVLDNNHGLIKYYICKELDRIMRG